MFNKDLPSVFEVNGVVFSGVFLVLLLSFLIRYCVFVLLMCYGPPGEFGRLLTCQI